MARVETVSLRRLRRQRDRATRRAEENGVSHFLEHMAFKGTRPAAPPRSPKRSRPSAAIINAYTAREQTAYYVKLLKEDIALGADIIGDILTH